LEASRSHSIVRLSAHADALINRCSRMVLAGKYFPQAATFMPNDLNLEPRYRALRHSEEFDYDSIMIYGSIVGRNPGAEGYPLLKANGDLIYTGDSYDPDEAGISDLDIERVIDLYPAGSIGSRSVLGNSPEKQPHAVNGTHVKRPWLEVVVSGAVTTTVKPVPTDFPKSINDSKAVELANKYNVPVPTDSATISASQPNKRWYSVPLDYKASPDGRRAWPACSDSTHVITYCFEDEAAHKDLNELFARALTK
jgi:hypothetical protein